MSNLKNILRSRLGIAAAVVALAPAAAFAGDVTVGPSGDYTTLSAAIAGAGDGNVFIVQDGTTLTETVNIVGRSDITIKAEHPWSATMAPTGDRAFYLESSSNVRIQGLKIVGGAQDGIYLAGGSLASTGTTIWGNEIRAACAASNASNNRGAISVGRGNAYTYIVNNLIRDNTGHGIAFGFDGNVGGTIRMIVMNNTVFRNTGSGLKAGNKELIWITNNAFVGNGWGSFGGYGLEQSESVVNPSQKLLDNNIFYKNEKGDLDDPRYWFDVPVPPAGTTTDHNNRTTYGTENSGTFASLSGLAATPTTFASMPQSHALGEFFVNLAQGNYRIAYTSPCVNAGLNTLKVPTGVERVPPTDWEGGSRPIPAGGIVDVGFDERPAPPNNANVIDTDRDGLSDLNESVIYGTDPDDADSDDDGIEDGVEIACLTNPLLASSPGLGTWVDADKDLIPDNLAGGFLSDPDATTSPRLKGVDSDNDRVQDFWEFAVNHQPASAGTLVSISDMMSGSFTSQGIGGKKITMGDIDQDGDVDMADALALLDWVNNGNKPDASFPELNEPETIRDADINRDRVVNGIDAVQLLLFTQHKLPYLPTR